WGGSYYYLKYLADFLGTNDGFFLRTAPVCAVDNSSNTCVIDSDTPQSLAIDALGGSDLLQLAGSTNFSFDVSAIGDFQTYRHFEAFQKTGASNVTLTGTATALSNWDVLQGTLTL